jgi:26S proteasome regulatory subunit N10
MILLDCSQYMRNGDYIPTRLEAQQDAANLLVGAKTQSHPESTVGVSAGTELLVSPTDDVGKILSAVHRVKMAPVDTSDIPAAVSVASLALKHRRNKNGAQRIVLFVGTPVSADIKALQKAGRLLKKNNVAIDVVAMGELEANEAVLQELVEAANGRSEDAERTCHLVTIPAGVLPSDVLASSPVLASSGGAFAAAAAGGFGGDDAAFADFGGVDPNMDPELAMALRVSMEEERGRQERAAAAAAAAGGDTEMTDAAVSSASDIAAEAGLSEEEALLQQALAMSMNENDPDEDTKPAAAQDEEDDDDMEEDAAMQMALQMSMAADNNAAESFQDPAFVNEMLKDMPGVDPDDPEIQEMLKKAAEEKKKKEGDDKKE